MQAWNRRLRNPVADYIVLWLSAYSVEPVYPYSIHSKLVELWNNEDAPALQSIYSSIKRLDQDKLIETRQEIEDGRVQKILSATPVGFDVLDRMQASFQEVTDSLQQFEVG